MLRINVDGKPKFYVEKTTEDFLEEMWGFSADGDLDSIKNYLDNEYVTFKDIYKHTSSLFIPAAREGHLQVLNFLLENIKHVNSDTNEKTFYMTIMNAAALVGNGETIRFMEANYDLDYKTLRKSGMYDSILRHRDWDFFYNRLKEKYSQHNLPALINVEELKHINVPEIQDFVQDYKDCKEFVGFY